MKLNATKRLTYLQRLRRLSGVFAIIEPSQAHTLFQDSALTVPAEAGDTVRGVKDVRRKVSLNFIRAAGDAPVAFGVMPGLNGIQFVAANAQLEGNAAIRAFTNNRSGLTVAYVASFPAAGGATKRIWYCSHDGGAGSIRAGGNVISGEGHQVQSRSLNTDGAQTTGGGLYTAGDYACRVDVIDYENARQTIYVDGAQVVTESKTYGATSTPANNSLVMYLSGGSGSLWFLNGVLCTMVFLTIPYPAYRMPYLNRIMKKAWGIV